MLINRFYQELDHLFRRIQKEQSQNIVNASGIIADSIVKGGALHLYDTEHIIDHELVGRAGGLVLMRSLRYTFRVDNYTNRGKKKSGKDERIGLAKYILNESDVREGDVLIINSVSSKEPSAVDLAVEARRAGVKVIVITTTAEIPASESEITSEKKLCELGDVVISNCAPAEDGMIKVEGLDAAICPASGLGAVYIMWALTARLVDDLRSRGILPTIDESINLPNGWELNDKIQKRYHELGY